MGRDQALYAVAEGPWPAPDDGFAGGSECRPVCFAQRLPLAVAAEGFSAALEGAALFRHVAR